MSYGHTKVVPVGARDGRQLAAEWDKVAADRDEVIAEGRDLSYVHILLPVLRQLSGDWLADNGRVLDVGCGTGKLATELAKDNPQCSVTGIDPSVQSIDIARAKRSTRKNLLFRDESIEDFVADRQNHGSFELVIANMLFQNVSSLPDALNACAQVMTGDGALVFAVPHPCFWPRYWEYERKDWFHYDQELWIEAPFRTSLRPNGHLTTTHTHRPLSCYVNAFTDAGLGIEKLVEPYPDEDTKHKYPSVWEFPRFLLGRCRPWCGGKPARA
jgi:SAM-dependent methyltransferase